MKPFRFGIVARNQPDGRAWKNFARRLEGEGYSSLLVADHINEQFGPIVAMTVAATVTDRLRVGPLVMANDMRHPVLVAKEFSTLDLLSEGRLEAGIGTGWMITDYQRTGVPLNSGRSRVDRLGEAVAIMKAFWSGEPFSFAGAHYKVAEQLGEPSPYRPGGPLLTIGGAGRRMLTLAARQADIVSLMASMHEGRPTAASVLASATRAHFAQRVEWVRQLAGTRLSEIELQCLLFFTSVTDRPDRYRQEVADQYQSNPEYLRGSPMVAAGTVETICEHLHQLREELGINYFVALPAHVDSLRPVVERLSGS